MPILHILQKYDTFDQVRGLSFYTTRKLSRKERLILSAAGVSRLVLPTLSTTDRADFFRYFSAFWAEIVQDRGTDDRFWRNGVSSKMQEWESSIGYFVLVLFTLSRMSFIVERGLVVLPSSAAEAAIWRLFARRHGWEIGIDSSGLWHRLLDKVINFARIFLVAFRIFYRKLLIGNCPPLAGDISILAVSLFYRNALKGEHYKDAFFGDLHGEALRKGINFLYLVDAIDGYDEDTVTKLRQSQIMLSIYGILSWADIWACIWMLFFPGIKLRKATFDGIEITNYIEFLGRSARFDFNIIAEMFYLSVRNICRRAKVGKLLYVFEGNVYERAIIQAFREQGGKFVDAFSHAVVYPLNLKLFLCSVEREIIPEPDRMLMCGERPLELIKTVRGVTIPLVRACSLKHIPSGFAGAGLGASVLVVLDGVWTSVNMVEWLFGNASVFSGWNVIIRPHPNVSGDNLWSQCVIGMPPGFTISSASLEDDLRMCFVVVYRQSSVGIQALANRIPVIHLAVDLPLPADPLSFVEFGRYEANNAITLRNCLMRIFQQGISITEMDSAQKAASNFFEPPTGVGLGLFLSLK